MSSHLHAEVAPAFANPVAQSQRVFRALLDAFAHPGMLRTLDESSGVPKSLEPAAVGVLVTLLDCDTPLWLAPEYSRSEVITFFRFHCGSPICSEPREARFAVIPAARIQLADFNAGELEYPERSATVIIQCDSLSNNSGVRLSGAGIVKEQSLLVSGLDSSFWRQWQENGVLFPQGVDVVFAAGNRLAALSRTTNVCM